MVVSLPEVRNWDHVVTIQKKKSCSYLNCLSFFFLHPHTVVIESGIVARKVL